MHALFLTRLAYIAYTVALPVLLLSGVACSQAGDTKNKGDLSETAVEVDRTHPTKDARKPQSADNRLKTRNRLIDETSPYLLMHAHNPVNWYPWGEEAFAQAKKENKVVFI